jgi:hypothetical protein
VCDMALSQGAGTLVCANLSSRCKRSCRHHEARVPVHCYTQVAVLLIEFVAMHHVARTETSVCVMMFRVIKQMEPNGETTVRHLIEQLDAIGFAAECISRYCHL